MRAKMIGILICSLLTLTGCRQKTEDASQAVANQNASRAFTPLQPAEAANVGAQPAQAAASPIVAGSPAVAGSQGEQPLAPNEASQALPDPCALLKSDEIEQVQGEPVKETKSRDQMSEAFVVSQCFYTTPTFSNSINLEITRRNPGRNSRRAMREFWDEKFHRDAGAEREREREEEKEGEANKPKLIKGIGDEAFWVRSAVGGALYVLKNDAFFRISLGGKGSDEVKMTRARALAIKAVNRL